MRKYKESPKDIKLPTKFGDVYLTITDGAHIYVDASGNGKCIEVKGKKYSFSCHLKCYDGKTWELSKDSNGRIYNAVYAKKYQCYDRDDAMPPSYQKLAVAEVIEAVTQYLANNQGQLKLAAIADKNNALLRVEEEVEELEAKLTELRAKRDQLDAELGAIIFKP